MPEPIILTTLSVLGSIASLVQLFEKHFPAGEITTRDANQLISDAKREGQLMASKTKDIELSERAKRLIERIQDEVDATWVDVEDGITGRGMVGPDRIKKVHVAKERICWFLKSWSDIAPLPEDYKRLRNDLGCYDLGF